MKETNLVYDLSAVRALALHVQGLSAPNEGQVEPALDDLHAVVERLGCLQIDTLQMVQRSHYLVLWSRLGRYNPSDFDQLAYHPAERRLFEGWLHAASIIPLKDFRYQLPLMRRLRESPDGSSSRWLAEPGSAELLGLVRDRIRQEGGLRASDFEYDGPRRGSWWDWKPAKYALEHLFDWGELMVADRVNFQRVYDLRERVLPDWVDLTEPIGQERDRHWIEQALRCLGACQPLQLAEYAYMGRGKAKFLAGELIAEGIAVPVNARLMDGQEQTLIVHKKNLPLLEQCADGAIRPSRTTFLSPFDSLFWAKGRDEQFWGFRHQLEAYKPAPQRVWGYFSLPILHHDRLVGRFDPKLERKNGVLRLKALHLEPGVEPSEDLVTGVATAMRDFLAFHRASDLVVERSQPAEFGEKLLAAL
ncbi:MAG TPA: crosslink repair DNA glycosylase YcaQ family protein [Anaerolineales bacterium]